MRIDIAPAAAPNPAPQVPYLCGMKVMKFGGAVLRGPEGFRQMSDILQRHTDERLLVVVSAFSTATRDLEYTARLAVKGQLDDARERLDHVVNDHRTLMKGLIPSPSVREALDLLLEGCRTELTNTLTGVSITRQLTPRTLDGILSYGEYMALHIARHVLGSRGIDVAGVDARDVIETDDRYGAARPLIDKTRVRVRQTLMPVLDAHHVVLIQGYVGRAEHGATTTMGKESSNLTASLLGSLLDAEEIVIWTDVAGIRSGDPQICEGTASRPRLSYVQARIAAEEGVKLLYPTMIDPAEQAGIPIRIAGAAEPDGDQTIIAAEASSCDPIVVLRDDMDSADNHVTVSVVFAPAAAWLDAAGTTIRELGVTDAFGLVLHPGDHTARLMLPRAHATKAAARLHARLV